MTERDPTVQDAIAQPDPSHENKVVVSIPAEVSGGSEKIITVEVDEEAGPYVTFWGFVDNKSQYEKTNSPDIPPHTEQRLSKAEIIKRLDEHEVSPAARAALQFIPDYLIDEALYYLDAIKNFPFKIEDITFVGHSFGAGSLLVAAMIEPKIKKIALLSPPHTNPKSSKRPKNSEYTPDDILENNKIMAIHKSWGNPPIPEESLDDPELTPTVRFISYLFRNIPETLRVVNALSKFEFEGALEMLSWLAREAKREQDPKNDHSNREVLIYFPEHDENFDYSDSVEMLRHLIDLKNEGDPRISVRQVLGTHAGPKELKQARVIQAARAVSRKFKENQSN